MSTPMTPVDSLLEMAAIVSDPSDQARLARYRKMEAIVAQMQKSETGVPIRDVKSSFLGHITPSVFTGTEMVDWLQKNYPFFDREEALHFAQYLARSGYVFPVDTRVLKDDGSFLRFQSSHFWISNNMETDEYNYAVYLVKLKLRDSKKHTISDHELEMLASMQRRLIKRWEFVVMQAEEQIKAAKNRSKRERRIFDSQERAFWTVAHPPPDSPDMREVDPRKAFSGNSKEETDERKRRANLEELAKKKIAALHEKENQLTLAIARPKIKISLAAESIVSRCEIYGQLDPLIAPMEHPNPWISDDTAYWTYLEKTKETPDWRSAAKWEISLSDLLADPVGLKQFQDFLKKEFSDENINFWLAVTEMQKVKPSSVKEEARKLFDRYVAPQAPHELNMDSFTRDLTTRNMESPGYDAFDELQRAVFIMMSKDSYPRFLRSDMYQNLRKSRNS